MSNDKVIYEHHWPGTSYYYVGIGYKHRATNFRTRSDYHKRLTAKYGKPLVTIMAEGLSWDEACSREIATIGFYRAAGLDLVNRTDGGEGTQGYRYTAEQSANKSGEGNPFFGKKHSTETLERMADAKKGRTLSTEHKAKIRSSLIGAVFSEERRARISAAKKGKTHSAETRAKLSAVSKGRRHTELSKAKLSAAFAGSNHPAYDPVIRVFRNDDGREFVGTKYELRRRYGIEQHGHITRLINGTRKSAYGWRYVGEYKEAA